jgi:hypothetical protein
MIMFPPSTIRSGGPTTGYQNGAHRASHRCSIGPDRMALNLAASAGVWVHLSRLDGPPDAPGSGE